eukprot:m.10952 g.10952  ORF g.10952 m.10952 type:complete len:69 (-) comp6772_c0_seq1:1053-1259(-)
MNAQTKEAVTVFYDELSRWCVAVAVDVVDDCDFGGDGEVSLNATLDSSSRLSSSKLLRGEGVCGDSAA